MNEKAADMDLAIRKAHTQMALTEMLNIKALLRLKLPNKLDEA